MGYLLSQRVWTTFPEIQFLPLILCYLAKARVYFLQTSPHVAFFYVVNLWGIDLSLLPSTFCQQLAATQCIGLQHISLKIFNGVFRKYCVLINFNFIGQNWFTLYKRLKYQECGGDGRFWREKSKKSLSYSANLCKTCLKQYIKLEHYIYKYGMNHFPKSQG